MTQVVVPPEVSFSDLVAHFGSQSNIARGYGVTRQAVQNWKVQGVPRLRAMQFAALVDTLGVANVVRNNADGVTDSAH